MRQLLIQTNSDRLRAPSHVQTTTTDYLKLSEACFLEMSLSESNLRPIVLASSRSVPLLNFIEDLYHLLYYFILYSYLTII